MATANTIIGLALKEIGVLGSGQAEDAAEFADALTRLNQMLDEWRTERLMVYQITDDRYTLVVDQSDYTIGESGSPDFSAVRPVKIVDAAIVDASVDPEQRYPVDVTHVGRWSERFIVPDYDFPGELYYETSYPNGTIHLLHVPTTAYELELFTWQPFAAFASLSTTVVLPPGYESALMYNLAVRLAPSYERPVNRYTARMARESRSKLESLNAPVPYLDVRGFIMPGQPDVAWRGRL